MLERVVSRTLVWMVAAAWHRLMKTHRPIGGMRRFAVRLAAMGLAVVTLFASATAGRAYFFCAAMDRAFWGAPCCAHFEASAEDDARTDFSAPMTLDDDDACCEARHRPALPSGTVAAAPDALESPCVGVVPSPPALATLVAPSLAPTFRAERATGPPPLSARESAARLSVFIL